MAKCGIHRVEGYAYLFQGKRLGMMTSVFGVTPDSQPGYLDFYEKFS